MGEKHVRTKNEQRKTLHNEKQSTKWKTSNRWRKKHELYTRVREQDESVTFATGAAATTDVSFFTIQPPGWPPGMVGCSKVRASAPLSSRVGCTWKCSILIPGTRYVGYSCEKYIYQLWWDRIFSQNSSLQPWVWYFDRALIIYLVYSLTWYQIRAVQPARRSVYMKVFYQRHPSCDIDNLVYSSWQALIIIIIITISSLDRYIDTDKRSTQSTPIR